MAEPTSTSPAPAAGHPTKPTTGHATVPILRGDEAVALAASFAERLAKGSAERDAERILPAAELDDLSESGLLALTVPAEYGGADATTETVTEVFRLLATGDPSVAQVPHSHFVYVNALRHHATHEQRDFLFAEVRRGKRFGNAQSELGTRHVRDFRTTLRPAGAGQGPDGDWILNGEKGYATGALLAHWIPVLAHLGTLPNGEGGPMHVAWVERYAPGVTVVDDWDGMGQRTTASGTVRLQDVAVAADRITPWHLTFSGPQVYGAFAQVLHAALDAGIARAAMREAAEFVTTRSRPNPDAIATYAVDRHADDPLTVQAFGELELAVRGAEALLAEAARAVDRAAEAQGRGELTEEAAGTASLSVAAARAATSAAAVDAASRLFEVGGTRSALDSLNLDRHWRNARTHTLHDPAAWKVHHLGRYAIDGTFPPNHGQV